MTVYSCVWMTCLYCLLYGIKLSHQDIMKHCTTKSFTEQTYLTWAIKHILKCLGLPVLTNGFLQTTWDKDPSAGEDWMKCWTRASPWLALVCHVTILLHWPLTVVHSLWTILLSMARKQPASELFAWERTEAGHVRLQLCCVCVTLCGGLFRVCQLAVT